MEIKHVQTYIFSTGVSNIDIKQYYAKLYIPVYNDWKNIITMIMARYKKAKVVVYPLASMQMVI